MVCPSKYVHREIGDNQWQLQNFYEGVVWDRMDQKILLEVQFPYQTHYFYKSFCICCCSLFYIEYMST